ncbi:MAG: hypothetical protein HOA22_11050 [Gammaproteobacteria bacterium]|jgi:hypothetical protein|nr:hypothetical protein [Gammaproteobacteria bacterium]HIJ25785.1 hypothetical protein [Gammaproteobacteria bacterium]HIJ29261.1 hypothetical protein [Gammaproteobacteria bacterium]
MNESDFIFFSIFSFGVGHAIAYSVKNVSRLYKEWGLLVCYFVFPPIFVVLVYSAAMIADAKDPILSTAFAVGFIYRMWRKR